MSELRLYEGDSISGQSNGFIGSSARVDVSRNTIGQAIRVAGRDIVAIQDTPLSGLLCKYWLIAGRTGAQTGYRVAYHYFLSLRIEKSFLRLLSHLLSEETG